MTSVIMVRHARTADNAARLFAGQSDTPVLDSALTAIAPWSQLRTEVPVAVFSSPQRRARQTAAGLFGSRGHSIDPRLAERHLGVLDGQSIDTVRREQPEIAEQLANDLQFAPAGGESAADVADRVRSFLSEVLTTWADNGPVVCVTHGGLMAITLRVLAGMTVRPQIANLEQISLRVNRTREQLDITYDGTLIPGGLVESPAAAAAAEAAR